MGFGAGLAGVCDVRVVSERALFAMPENGAPFTPSPFWRPRTCPRHPPLPSLAHAALARRRARLPRSLRPRAHGTSARSPRSHRPLPRRGLRLPGPAPALSLRCLQQSAAADTPPDELT